ncbi:SRPBCC domain-containing protein [Tamlana flava]|uniref:SRPBCC domain-containing protein n=1 Tax=Tamlana flava TaxID=3158572 RepID=UPI00351B9B30
MDSKSNLEIFSARTLIFPVEEVYRAFTDPSILKNWWGPNGFTNTIHEFDLKPGGKWILTMHGPEKGDYENSSVFEIVKPNELVRWKRISQPWFDMEIAFKKIAYSKSQISFRMIFKTAEECNKIRAFAEPKNEENFDRLENVLANL